MIARTIEYIDYNGNKRKEKHWFNLTQLEATEIALELPDDVVEELGQSENQEEKEVAATHLVDKLGQKGVLDFIKMIVLKSYGSKSADGREFIKNERLTTSFVQSPAYSAFMLRLMNNDDEASRFIQGVIPADLATTLNNRTNTPATKSDVIDFRTDDPADIVG